MYLDKMNVTMDHNNTVMNNINQTIMNNINQTLQFGTIPKRVPIDNMQWLQSSTTFGRPYLTQDEIARMYGERDFSFYLVLSLLTLGFVCGILFLYICFCAWAMKGNMDLPLPGGGGVRKTSVLKFVNPLKDTRVWNMFRYKINDCIQPGSRGGGGGSGVPTATIPPPTSSSPASATTPTNDMKTSADQRRQQQRGSAAAAGADSRIQTISHNQFQQLSTPSGPAAADSGSNPGPGGSDRQQPRNIAVAAGGTGNKSLGLHDSFKQFKQFRYDYQLDEEPEHVVFDVYDIGHDR